MKVHKSNNFIITKGTKDDCFAGTPINLTPTPCFKLFPLGSSEKRVQNAHNVKIEARVIRTMFFGAEADE